MSYSSRVYRQRNAHMHDESKQKSFFAGHETKKPTKKNKQVQAKLAINKPGDSFEKEADAVANVVTTQPLQKPAIEQKKISSVQRLSTPAEEEKLGTNDARMKRDKDIQEKPIQAKDEEKKEKPEVQKMDEPEKEKPEVQKAEAPEKKEEEMKKPESVRTLQSFGFAVPQATVR